MKTFYILGGDERLLWTLEALLGAGYKAEGSPHGEIEEEKLKKADVILCGVPFTGDGRHLFAPFWDTPFNMLSLLERISPRQILFGGNIPEPFIRSMEKKGLRWADYAKEEEFQVKNALLTAEGAILLALKSMKTTLHGASILVFGYGRIGKMLSERLALLGAKVTVVTGKKENFAWLMSRGMRGVSSKEVPSLLPKFDCIFNTVPTTVMEEKDWKDVRENTVVIELASRPGGFPKAPEGRVISGGALPGKTAPRSAGIIIKETVMDILERQGS